MQIKASLFTQVKEALTAQPESTLSELGIKLKGPIKGTWTQCLCPSCGDTSGSASITQEGFLRCHQCSRKQDVFQWYGELNNLSTWEACKALAQHLNIEVERPRRRGKPPPQMSQEVLQASIVSLWEDDQARQYREFLAKRKLDDPQILEAFGVGHMAGFLTFAQWTPTGYLRPCYRTYMAGSKPPWFWKGGMKGGTVGFWPHVKVPKDGVIWLMEGEFDCLTGWIRLRLQEQGIYCFTWTGGAGSPINLYDVPEAWWGREIHIVPDNDVFQGPTWEQYKAPDDRRYHEMRKRWENLMNRVAPSFLGKGCKVFLRTVPIDPQENWGGDFRDWVDGGGRNLADLVPHLFKDMRPPTPPPIKTDFFGVFDCVGKHVQFTAQVSAIQAEGLLLPAQLNLDCDMGNMPYCSNCKAPQRLPNQVVHTTDFPDDVAAAMIAKDFEAHMMRYAVGKPAACSHAKLTPGKYEVMNKWIAIQDTMEDTNDRSITVISRECPSLTGEIEISGKVYFHNQRIIVMADQILQMDSTKSDFRKQEADFLNLCPSDTDKPDVIQEYMLKRCEDLAYNVTKIYGRHELHLAHELLVHSALWMVVDDVRVRAWLDMCTMGPTRTGKSMTFQRLMEHHGLGLWQNCGENISRAGLTMGGERAEGGYRLKPGLFPRAHRKVLVLDEFHDIVKEQILRHLQGARDEGKVYAAKVYGSRIMPACVRFATIANWPHDKERFRFLCEHFQALYGLPECLSRMDFGLIVTDEPSETELLEVEHRWNDNLVRTLILRAWAMDESMVHFTPEALQYAKQKCKEWTGYYAHDIPLFTPEEKHLTILRMAIAAANMLYSHPKEDASHCLVNIGHVVWAAEFLEMTWKLSEYEGYSIVLERKKTLEKPFDVEAEFSIGLSLDTPSDASTLLPDFMGGFSMSEACALVGKESYDVSRWVNKMIRLGVFMQSKSYQNGYYTNIKLTKAGDTFLRNLLTLAEEYPRTWRIRLREIKEYAISKRMPQVVAMTEPRAKLKEEWSECEKKEDPIGDVPLC